MWKTSITPIENRTATQYSIEENGTTLDFGDIINLWQNDHTFRAFYTSLLKDAPYDGYFWEAPPITKSELNRPYEFVLVNSSTLPSISPNRNAFSEYFENKSQSESIVSFMNLGKDARLVVPCPIDEFLDYPHLASFIRNAPMEQIHEFWKCVGYHMERHVSDKHTWLSTAGLGVYWLHIRLDSRPKYYRYAPYKTDFWR